MKRALFLILIVLLAGAGYWYGARAGWFVDTSPSNLPTKDDIRRMDAVEESSSQIAPDAKAGAGVRPVGSLQKETPPEPVSTTSEEVKELP